MKRFLFLPLFAVLSCLPPSGVLSVSKLAAKCEELKNSTVEFRGTFGGWNCPGCPPPPVSRSDACIYDAGGCVYAVGVPLDPIRDRGKEFVFTAKVEGVKGNACTVRVLGVSPIVDDK